MSRDEIEYPDDAGYPDGMGVLDEGTAEEVTEGAGSASFVTPSAEAPGELRVLDEPEAGAYRAVVGGREVGVIRYSRRDSAPIVLHSTYVDPELRGDGIATGLIVHVLDERRDRGEQVVVECPVIRRFIETHPDYADVVVR